MSTNDESMLPSVLGSAAAGIVSRACTHPLDTAKARLQAPVTAGEPIYKGPMDTLWRTFRAEGPQGLYRGFGAVIVGGTPGTMLVSFNHITSSYLISTSKCHYSTKSIFTMKVPV